MNKEIEKAKEDYYWKGYLQKQSEDVEICNLCKYRKKTKTLDKVTYKLKEDILKTKEEIKYWEGRYRNAKESNKKSFYRQINRCQSKFETLREILKIIEGGKK